MLRDKDDEGSTPLLLGVGSGRKEIVRILLDHKANVNTTNTVKNAKCQHFHFPD